MVTAIAPGSRPQSSLRVQVVRWSQPFAWLLLGWQDLRAHWMASLAHGALIAGLWLVLLTVAGTHPYMLAALMSGFMLIAPVMSGGLCELSRRQGTDEALTFDGSAAGVSAHGAAMMRFGALLAALTVAWFLISVVALNTLFHRPEPSLGEVLYGGFLSSSSPQQLLDYLAIGGVLALAVLAMSVVAVPLILDRGAGAGEAIRTSLRVTAANIPAMMVWSALLVVMVAIGFATALVGLVVVVPVMGHATWHAYRDTVHARLELAGSEHRHAA